MVNFRSQFTVSQKTTPSSKKLKTATGRCPLLLRCCPLLRSMPQTPSFDQAIKIFREIGSVIPGAFQRLRHKNHVEVRRIVVRRVFGEVLLKQSMTDAVDVLI